MIKLELATPGGFLFTVTMDSFDVAKILKKITSNENLDRILTIAEAVVEKQKEKEIKDEHNRY